MIRAICVWKALPFWNGSESRTTAGVQVQAELPLGQTDQSLTIWSVIHGSAAMTLLGGMIEFQAPPQDHWLSKLKKHSSTGSSWSRVIMQGWEARLYCQTGQISAKPISSHVTYLSQFSFYTWNGPITVFPWGCCEDLMCLYMRESIPRQVNKKSGVPKEEKGVWGSQSRDRGLAFSRRRKGQTSLSLSLHSLVLVT